MKCKRTLYLAVIALMACATTAQASDDSHCISKQLKAHEQAEQQLLLSFATGNRQQTYDATVNLVASETYLAVCGFPGNDARIHGNLNNGNGTPESFAVAIFHKRLFELTHFQPDAAKALSEVHWNRIEGATP